MNTTNGKNLSVNIKRCCKIVKVASVVSLMEKILTMLGCHGTDYILGWNLLVYNQETEI